MKIRIKGNSIRLRLTKSEVDAFGKNGYIEERTEFGNHLFMYALRVNPDATELMAGFVGIKITVQVPTWMANEWTTTDQVGYSNVYTYDNGKQLSILLEKDFVCLDAVGEDQSDNYENPLHNCGPAQQAEESTPAVQYEVVQEQPEVHYELVDESLPADIEEIAESPLTPVEMNDNLSEEELSEEQCSGVEELMAYHENEALRAADEEPVKTAESPAAELPHEAMHQAMPVANDPVSAEQYPAVEMPAHEAVTEAIIVADEPGISGETPTMPGQKVEDPHWKSYWDTTAHAKEAKEEAEQHSNNEEPVAPVAQVEEQHPWMQPEQEESPAAPIEPPTSTPPTPPRTGPVRPPNWR